MFETCPPPPWPLNAACSHLPYVSSKECYWKYFSRIISPPGPSCLGLLLPALGFPTFLPQLPVPVLGPPPYLSDTSRHSSHPFSDPQEPFFHSGTLCPRGGVSNMTALAAVNNPAPFDHHHLHMCLQSSSRCLPKHCHSHRQSRLRAITKWLEANRTRIQNRAHPRDPPPLAPRTFYYSAAASNDSNDQLPGNTLCSLVMSNPSQPSSIWTDISLVLPSRLGNLWGMAKYIFTIKKMLIYIPSVWR